MKKPKTNNILVSVFTFMVFAVIFLLSIHCGNNCLVAISPEEAIIYECSDRYGIPSSLLKGIRWAESMDGKAGILSDSYKVLIRQDWIKNYPYRKELVKKYGKSVYWCLGQMQVCWFSARDCGFKGGPMGLTNFATNCKYASKILANYLWVYRPYVNTAISAYNSGTVEIIDGCYRNQKYVDRVWRVYTNQFPGGYKE